MAVDTSTDAALTIPQHILHHTRTYDSEHREALERDHWGRSALMVDGKIIDLYDTGIDAYRAGIRRFGQRNFATRGIGAVNTGYCVVDAIA